MLTFEIAEDAVKVAVGTVQPAAAALPALSDEARELLHESVRALAAGGLLAVRRVTANRSLTQEVRDWFIKAEETLAQSPQAEDRTLSRVCAAAANVLIGVFAASGYGPRVR